MTCELRMAAELSQAQIASLIIAVEQLGDIIGDSRGVAGLHLNGDVAEWGELLGTWLDGYDEAAAPIKALHEAEIARLERCKNENWARRQIAKATGALDRQGANLSDAELVGHSRDQRRFVRGGGL